MGRKLAIRGNKLRNESDSTLAHSHQAGAIVSFVQPARDNVWGRYYFVHYMRHYWILSEARLSYRKSLRLLKRCRDLEVNPKTLVRHIPDDLKERLDVASMEYVILIKLGFEYLTAEMMQRINNVRKMKFGLIEIPWEDTQVINRLRTILTNLGSSANIPTTLISLITRRDIVEHPTQERLYNCKENEWKNVHLSWVLSGELEGSLKEIVNFVNPLMKQFEEYAEANKVPGTLTGVKRGIKSTDPYKKPVNTKKVVDRKLELLML